MNHSWLTTTDGVSERLSQKLLLTFYSALLGCGHKSRKVYFLFSCDSSRSFKESVMKGVQQGRHNKQ